MSKSLGNYVGIRDEANEMFGKLMSISDRLMLAIYFELLSFRPTSEIAAWRRQISNEGLNPRDVKFKLAEVVARFHSAEAGQQAQAAFIERFQKGALPEEVPEARVQSREGRLPIANLLKEARTGRQQDFRGLSTDSARRSADRW